MTSSGLLKIRQEKLTVLCLGAHSDDIEIGCGGTILRLLQDSTNCNVIWVVFSAEAVRKKEAVASAKRFLKGAQTHTIITKSFKTSFFPYRGEQIKAFFEQLKARVSPDVIFSHYRHDRHQDHRLICELTWNTFRSHLILEYEIPKYDGDLGQPNVYVPFTDDISKRKVDLLMQGFSTQRDKQWFTEDTFYGLLRMRGIESPVSTRYAEAFYGRKVVLW
ncbi:MAG: PIG-L family deacetylase [Nitrospira sp.]|nr:PIG-L family deacetylase [Nitrospira sp.]